MAPDLEVLETQFSMIAGTAHSVSQLIGKVRNGKYAGEDLTATQLSNIKQSGIGLIQDIRDAMVIIEAELS